MSQAVVEVGPAGVCGPSDAPAELVCAAMECVDDEVGLLGERAVSATELWADLMRAVAGRGHDAVVLVCPTWWSAARVERARAAAARLGLQVAVQSRGPLLADNAPRQDVTVVEIAADVIAVTGYGTGAVIPIVGGTGAVGAKVRAAVGNPVMALIDAPAAVDGARSLGDAIADRLRQSGIAVGWADDDAVRRAASAALPRRPATDECRSPAHRMRKASAVAGMASTVAVCVGFALWDVTEEIDATRWLVEGRVGVLVPADWPLRRITSGPGSARLQLDSPSDGDVALHLTQSVGTVQADLVHTAESLRAALTGESDDVFVDFRASDVRVGRPAVTYREVRRDRHVAWTVLVDRSVRIAVGCQSPPERDDLVREACDQAVGSAHAVP